VKRSERMLAFSQKKVDGEVIFTFSALDETSRDHKTGVVSEVRSKTDRPLA
jgi:hypothetical protein